jgi:hypothetical protein
MSACQWPLETWKSSFRLWCSSHGQILPRIVPVSFFLTAAPDRGKTSLVRPCEWSYSDFIYFPHLYIHTYWSSVLHYSDGANYLVVDGANSLWQRASMIMSLSHQTVVVGHSIHLCLHHLHRCLQWALRNYWLHRKPSCWDWPKVLSVRQDNHSINNSLKNPPTLTSCQHNSHCSPRRQTRLKLTTGFMWLGQSLDCFTVLSFKRLCFEHNSYVVLQVLGGPRILPLLRTITKCCGWVLQSIMRALLSSRNHALQPARVPGSTTRGQQCVWVH